MADWDRSVSHRVSHPLRTVADALGGKLVAVWQDNRTDDAYSVQLPIGNTRDAQRRNAHGLDQNIYGLCHIMIVW